MSLLVEAGRARHPKTGKWVDLGLPWGTKPRLILAHLNAEAVKHESRVIDRALIDLDGRGMTLHHSLPPVTERPGREKPNRS